MTIWQSQKSVFHFGFSLCELGLAGAWRLVTSIDIKREWLETLYSKDIPAGDLLCTIQIIWQLLFSEFQVMKQSFWRISNVVVADFLSVFINTSVILWKFCDCYTVNLFENWKLFMDELYFEQSSKNCCFYYWNFQCDMIVKSIKNIKFLNCFNLMLLYWNCTHNIIY